MNRNDLKVLAELRLKEAEALLKKRLYDGAYYLTGYAIECGLKACIAKKTRRFDFPDLQVVKDSYIHDLKKLIKVSGLQTAHDEELDRDGAFAVNWAIVKDWNEGSRYERHDASAAKSIYAAVTDDKHGVMKWLRRYW